MGTIKRICISVILSSAVFIIITIAGALMIRYLPVPESWGYGVIIAGLSAACFAASVSITSCAEKGGLILGILISMLVVIFAVVMVNVLFVSSFNWSDLVEPLYLIPVAAGAIGGIFGVNTKK